MKALLQTLLISCVLSAPALAFAQANNGPMTPGRVHVDLVQMEQAGLEMGGNISDDFIGVEDLLAQTYEDEVYAALSGTQTPPLVRAGSDRML
jgi:hypothetical protein